VAACGGGDPMSDFDPTKLQIKLRFEESQNYVDGTWSRYLWAYLYYDGQPISDDYVRVEEPRD
jgi:hypothetical protein